MNANPTPCNAALLVALVALPCPALAGGWAFAPGAYTHNPVTGQRVAQYAQHAPVEALPDPRQTLSRYTRTQTNLRGADGSQDTVYEVRSFGSTLGAFDAQRERGFDAQLQTLDALRPFRNNPFLFFGGLQGFGYGTPGYPAAPPGVPVPAINNGVQQVPPPPQVVPHATPQAAPCNGPGCQGAQAPVTPVPSPAPGLPGTAWPYAPPTGFVAPYYPPFGYGFGFNGGFGGINPYAGGLGRIPYGAGAPWWGYGPGRQSYVPGTW